MTEEYIQEELLWLESCVHVKESITWSKFHSELIKWCELSTILNDRTQRSFLALEVMRVLVQSRKPAGQLFHDAKTVSDHDREILTYIAGYLLHKMRKRHADIASVLTCTQQDLIHVPNRSWFENINQGGLVMPDPIFVAIVNDMELAFRSLPSTDRTDYVAAVTNDITLTVEDFDDETVSNFISATANLFYTVRIHQRCRQIIQLQALASKSSTVKKSKALRDRL